MTSDSIRVRDGRFRGSVAVLDIVRREPGITRSAMAGRLGLSSGSATEIMARLRDMELLDEDPAPVTGPGRPTTVLRAHALGPVVVAVDLRQEDWRLAVSAVDGSNVAVTANDGTAATRHADRDPTAVLAPIAAALAEQAARLGARLRAVVVAVPGAVTHERLVQASTLGWGKVDLTTIAHGLGVPLLLGNDATLSGVAEARSGAAAASGLALHLMVVVGVGGTLVIDGHPLTGATGAAGEYGHMPFGDPELLCPCGAMGCWDITVDGRALARHLGAPPPRDPVTYTRTVLAAALRGDGPAGAALARVAAALGRGIAGLVNAHDPDIVTLGGLGWPLREAAPEDFDQAYEAGLMNFRRSSPPPVLAAAHGEDGAMRGAIEVGLDAVISEEGLAAWSSVMAGRAEVRSR